MQSIFDARIVKIDKEGNSEVQYRELEIGAMDECVQDDDCDYKIYAEDANGHYQQVGEWNSITQEFFRSPENAFYIVL